MNDLLAAGIAAQGGLDRWKQINTIGVDASITGAIWWEKGKVDALKDVHFEVDTRTERLGMDFVGQDKRSTFEPHRVVIERADGKRDVAHVDGDEQGLRDPLVVTLPRVDAAGRGDHDAVDVAVVLSPNTRFTLNR